MTEMIVITDLTIRRTPKQGATFHYLNNPESYSEGSDHAEKVLYETEVIRGVDFINHKGYVFTSE